MRFRALLLGLVFAAGLTVPFEASAQQTTTRVSRKAKVRKAKKRKYKKYKAKKAKRRKTTRQQRTL
jgi:hypothetical protein